MMHAVVMRLVDPIKGRGHHVYMDNYYTSPQLFSDLHDNGFGACGTVRINHRGLPAALKENVRKGEMKVIQMDNSMLAIKWMDKRAVTALTTIHDNTSVAVERRNTHAAGGRESDEATGHSRVNRYMGGVDHADQLLSYYGFGHRTVKWWRRAFFFLLDMAVVNSYILYTLQNPDKRRRLSHKQFRVTLATDLLHVAALATGSVDYGPRRQLLQPAARLTERHFPISLGKSLVGWLVQCDCCVCSKKKGRKRKTTTYKCRQCDLPMCIVPCFELHHTKRDPQKYLEQVC